MKRLGFTLAEVLITLGIIGVVAALTMPAIVNRSGNAHIGPTLQKTVSTIELANEAIMHEEYVSDLNAVTDSYTDDFCVYMDRLTRHIANSSTDAGTTYRNGIIIIHTLPNIAVGTWNPEAHEFNNPSRTISFNNGYAFYMTNNVTLVLIPNQGLYDPRGSYLGSYMQMEIDINGAAAKPNEYGTDLFRFIIDRNGKVIPWGSKEYAWLTGDHKWNDSGEANQCNKDDVQTGFGCAGSIFENNLKVIYQ